MYSYQCCSHRSHSHRRDCWAPRSRSCVEGAGSDGQDGGPGLAYICTAFVNNCFVGYHSITKYVYIKEYHSECMSPRRNWDSPNPSLASECAPPPQNRGWGGHTHSLRVRGWGSHNSDDWRKSLALCLLCGYDLASSNCRLVFQMNNIKWCLNASAFFFVKHSYLVFVLSYKTKKSLHTYKHKLLLFIIAKTKRQYILKFQHTTIYSFA